MGSNLEDFLVEEASPEKNSPLQLLSMSTSLSHGFFCSCSGLLSVLSLCPLLAPPDPKLFPIPLTPNGHLDPNLPLGGHLGPAGAAAPARLSLQPDPMLVALGSRKSSVMSLGRVSYDQRSLVSSCGCAGWPLPDGYA